tara:strand:+ start:1270 stop:1470 length:201 start_codon:yes stop_codon:yes gene_type:complete
MKNCCAVHQERKIRPEDIVDWLGHADAELFAQVLAELLSGEYTLTQMRYDFHFAGASNTKRGKGKR